MKYAKSFENAIFIGEDFDGTIADTFTAPRGGYSVEDAYKIAVGNVFGTLGLHHYNKAGGLRNRAPLDVVRELAPEADALETIDLLTCLDSTKLEVLLSQISTAWPEPIPGFIAFAEKLRHAQTSRPIDDVIISSGHDSFIKKTFEKAFGIDPPKIILAQEAIQRIALEHGSAMPTKPSPKLMVYAYNKWRQQYDEPTLAAIATSDTSRMQYVGDDAIKDGLMAARSGINFTILSTSCPEETWQELATIFEQKERAA